MAASIVRRVVKNYSAINVKDAFILTKHKACPLYNTIMHQGKHYDPRFRQRRKEKYLFINQDERKLFEQDDKTSSLEKRKERKEKNEDEEPMRTFKARSNSFIETDSVVDPYVPPEGDGKHSVLEIERYKDVGKRMFKKAEARMRAVRKIRKHGEPNFDIKEIGYELQDIYIDAHNMLTDLKKNKLRIYDVCTSHAIGLMTHNLERRTFRWEYIDTLEPPKVVHVFCSEYQIKELYFAQVTVRFHTKQKLAMYDQFGRLMFGNPHLERDVLDFIVFEKNIVDLYGKWRMHEKLYPDWLPKEHKHVSLRLSEEY